MTDHDWIADAFTSDTGWSHLETLVDISDRMAGSDGEREAAEATRDALEDVGARDAHREAFDVQGWVRGESSIAAGDTEQECIALPRSPADEVSGELVDVGYGLPEDFEDADLEGDDVDIPREDVSRTLVVALEAESTYGATFELAAGDEPIEGALQEPLDG